MIASRRQPLNYRSNSQL